MSTVPTVPMFSPDGKLGDIPQTSMTQAMQAGAIPGVHVTDPNGNPGVIPANRMAEAVKAGAKIEPLHEQPIQHEGFWSTMLGDLGDIAKGAFKTGLSASAQMMGTPAPLMRRVGLTPMQDQAKQMIQTVRDIPKEDQARKAAGRSDVYTALAPVPEMLGVNVQGMEKSAQQGDVGGVLGHAAAPTIVAAAPLGVEGAARLANRVIPSTTRAGAGLNALTDSPEAAFANHPVETPTALEAARKIRNELEVTGEKPHQIIQHYMAGEDLRSPAGAEAARQIGVPPPQPMTMFEARTMLKRVNDIIRNSSGFGADAASKTSLNNLKRFASALDEDISNAAKQGGFGKDYEAMRNEYASGKRVIRAAENVGEPLGAAIGLKYGQALGEPLGAAYVGGRVGKALGKATIGKATRAVIERSGGPPRLSSVPATPESFTRTLLDAKEGLITPEEANARIQRAGGRVGVRPIPQPQD